MSGVIPWHRTVPSCPCDSTAFSQHCVFGMVLGLILIYVQELLDECWSAQVKMGYGVITLLCQCIRDSVSIATSLFSQMDISIQWICLKIQQR